MQKEIEREVKSLLTKEEYLKIMNLSSREWINIFNKNPLNVQHQGISDEYFETQNEYFKKKDSVLRVRRIDNLNRILNLKIKSDNESAEYMLELSDKEYKKLINTKRLTQDLVEKFKESTNLDFSKLILKINASIYHYRFTINFENFKLDLDNSIFEKSEDYELEIESTISKEDASEKLELLVENGVIYFKKSFPKIKRYFDYTKDPINDVENSDNPSAKENEITLSNSIVIVEGKNDEKKLKQVFESINTFQTHGLGIQTETIDKLKSIVDNNNLNVIVFTDPDQPGEYLRNLINENFNCVYHIHITKEKANNKKRNKIGIEHATEEDIKEAFKDIYKYDTNFKNDKYSILDLIELGVYQDKKKRKNLCTFLNISFGNNQKIIKQLNGYNIPVEKLKEFSEREFPN